MANEDESNLTNLAEVIDAEQLKKLPPDQQQAALQVVMNQVTGLADTPPLTEKQTDELLAQRRLILDYTRADRKDAHDRHKTNTITVRILGLVGVVAFLVIFLSVLLVKPDLLPELLSLIIGGGGGYGLGRAQGSNKEQP